MQEIPVRRLQDTVSRTAAMCLESDAAAAAGHALAADSTGIATDRHKAEPPKKSKDRHEKGEKRERGYVK